MRAWKIASAIGTAALLASLAAGAGYAQGRHGPGGHPGGGGGGPHPGGGGVPHIGGGGGGPHMGGGGGPHFAPHIGGGGGPHFAPHIGAGPHFAPHVHVGRGGGPSFRHFAPSARNGHIGRPNFAGRFHPHGRGAGRIAHGGRPPGLHGGRLAGNHQTPNLGRTNAGRTANLHPGNLPPGGAHVEGRIDPHNFAAHRHFADIGAFRPFLDRRGYFHHHYGWLGPLFWPYAYGDFFYYALWPDEYASYDPFWYYGYGDIYEGIFSPYNYTEYVQGPDAPQRSAALTQSATQSCADEANEVTGWPIDQIEAALQPNKQQSALLDALGSAVVKAGDVIRAHCPAKLAFAPTDRLGQMQDRLEGLVEAVTIVQPPLAQFYASLSDEQKARFNAIGAPQGKSPDNKSSAQNKQGTPSPQAECGGSAISFPTDKIAQSLHLDDSQHGKLAALADANAKAANLIKASCPNEPPATPPDRLAAEGKHLQAMLQAVHMIRPPLNVFYNSLSDEQKARFNDLGQQLFAQNNQ
jgi:LTXXQ motif family protein